MRHIKVFENFKNPYNFDKLRELSESCLAYLLDDGIKIQINGNSKDTGLYTLLIHKYGYGFEWDEVKDHFIPFMTMLSKEYIFKSQVNFVFNDSIILKHSINEILNDNIDTEGNRVFSISIDLKDKE